MTTLGDVLAVIGGIVAYVVSLWALVISISLLFGERVARAQARIQQAPGRTILIGGAVTVVLGIFSLAFLDQPPPGAKFIGWVMALFLLAVAAIGLSGLANLLAQRLLPTAPSLSPFGALSRATFLCIAATLVPILGWFLVAPLVVFVSVGAGVHVLRATAPVPAPSQPSNATAA